MIAELIRSIRMMFVKIFIGNPMSFKLILIDLNNVKPEYLELFNSYRRKLSLPCVLIPVHNLEKPIEVIDLGYNVKLPKIEK